MHHNVFARIRQSIISDEAVLPIVLSSSSSSSSTTTTTTTLQPSLRRMRMTRSCLFHALTSTGLRSCTSPSTPSAEQLERV
ncbi:hypothetical protein TcWFU_004834 [Taenia crassiceps]|uniref:Uncharacterized protein n=1 Tax=Taenia crassiceps TaxID=6207 RepID=A0ABR4QH38_9CEST